MASYRDTLNAFTDAAADAVARAIAEVRREAALERAHDRELREAEQRAWAAEHRAALADLAAAAASLREAEQRVNDRLATLKDGEAGQDGRDGQDGAPGRDGADGRDGVDAPAPTDEQVAAALRGIVPTVLAGAVADYLSAHPVPAGRDGKDGIDGKDGRDGVDAPPITTEQIADAVAAHLAANPPAAGRDGRDGKDGDPGPEGPPGKLPSVREWRDAVHYDGDVVTHGGSLYQAIRDTGREPPHEDWTCIVAAGAPGADGRSMVVRGTWSEAETYRCLDVVAFNGASFVARRDDPGPCPGDGWQMVAAQGRRGNPGEPGRHGDPGTPGLPGPAVKAMEIDDDGILALTHGDGSRVTLDLYPLLSRLDGAKRF